MSDKHPLKYGPAFVEDAQERIGCLLVIPEGGVGVELGVEWGTNANLLYQIAKPKHLTLIDVWNNPDPYEATLERFRGKPNVTIRRKRGREVFSEFADSSLDWIFIDANHAYEAVKEDLEQWFPKVKMGGWIIMHDYGMPMGVTRAVDEFLEKHNDLHYVGLLNDYAGTVILRKWNGSVVIE